MLCEVENMASDYKRRTLPALSVSLLDLYSLYFPPDSVTPLQVDRPLHARIAVSRAL